MRTAGSLALLWTPAGRFAAQTAGGGITVTVLHKLLLISTAAAIVAGCSGGGGAPLPSVAGPGLAPYALRPSADHVMAPAPSANTPLASTGRRGPLVVSLQGDRNELVDLSHIYPRLKHRTGAAPFVRGNASPFKSLSIDGEIWPSYVGGVPVTVTAKAAAPTSSSISASVTFANVPKGNNEFVVLSVYGVAANGAQTFLGDLSTLANVTSASPKVGASRQSTLIFEATQAVIQAGLFTAGDLASATLSNQVSSEIKAQAIAANPKTGLYDDQTLVSFAQTWAPKIQRVLELTVRPSADYVTVANDATNDAENLLYLNQGPFAATSDLTTMRPYGAPCNATIAKGPPGIAQSVIASSCYSSFTTAYNVTLPSLIVYGNALLVGQVSYATPYTGSLQKAGPFKMGTSASLVLAPLNNSANELIATHDPFDWAFGTTPAIVRSLAPNSPLLPDNSDGTFAPNSGFQAYKPSGWGASNPDLGVLAWNPWNLNAAQFEACTWNNACIPQKSTKVLQINPPFHDPGTNISYYHWAANQGSSLTVEPAGSCGDSGGYQFATNSNWLWSMSTTGTQAAPIWFEPQQWLYFVFHGGCSIPGAGSTITVTARGKDGYFYVNTVHLGAAYSAAYVVMSSVNKPTLMASVTITGTVPAGQGQVDLDRIDIGFPSNLYNVAHGKPPARALPTLGL